MIKNYLIDSQFKIRLTDPLIKNFIHRVPPAADVDVDTVVNAPDSFTPDTKMIRGESAEVNFFQFVNSHVALDERFLKNPSQKLFLLFILYNVKNAVKICYKKG